MCDDRPPRWAREKLTQITTVERDGRYYAREPGSSITGRGDDPFLAMIHYLEFCRDSRPQEESDR